MYLKSGIMKNALLLCLVGLLTSCSAINSNVNSLSSKGSPQDISSSYAPELSAAYKAYDEGRLSDAETLFLKYTNKHPRYAEAWFKLGNIYYRTGQYAAAITAYNNVVQQNPNHGKAWYNMALTRIKQAEATLERGESILPVSDIQRQRLIALKNNIRSGVRQRRPVKMLKTPRRTKNTTVKRPVKKPKRVIRKPSRYHKKK